MQIYDKYIIYTSAASENTEKERKSLPLTPGVWQNEMLQLMSLFNDKEAIFTPISSYASQSDKEVLHDNGDVKTRDTLPIESKSEIVPLEEVQKVIDSRSGKVLAKGSVLKADQYPKLHNKKLQQGLDPQPLIDGAPNYRKIKGEEIYGVAQPTIDGIKSVLREAGAAPGCQPKKKAIWINLREEPVIYINGKPYSLRKQDNIFKNVEKPGVEKIEVEKNEEQLKKEMLEEAKKNGGKILITEETPDGKIVHRWEKIGEDSIKTPKEVYDELKKEGYNVEYERVPITDEKRPENKDFDALTKRLKDVDPNTPIIFNCHAGRGRTTTGTVIASILRNRKAEAQTGIFSQFWKNAAVKEDIREQGNYKRKEYKTIFGFLRMLKDPVVDRKKVDELIDKSDHMQNLREAAKEEREKLGEMDPKAKEYLERYHYLLAYDTYVKEQGPKFEKTFERWIKEHPEYMKQLENIKLSMGFVPEGDTAMA